MIKGVTSAGLGRVGSLEEFIVLAGENGFGAVDTDGSSLEQWIAGKGLSACREFLKEHRVVIGAIGLPLEWRNDEESFVKGFHV